jgi:hypothetical protein
MMTEDRMVCSRASRNVPACVISRVELQRRLVICD